MELMIFEAIMLATVMLFGGVGVWALRSKGPVHFWSGTQVKPEEITDIPAYNKANAKMWFCFCVPLVASMLIAPFNMVAAGVTAGAGVLAGIVAVIIVYSRIERKYKKIDWRN